MLDVSNATLDVMLKKIQGLPDKTLSKTGTKAAIAHHNSTHCGKPPDKFSLWRLLGGGGTRPFDPNIIAPS